MCHNRRLTGTDNRHAPTLSAFGTAIGQAYGATSFTFSGTVGASGGGATATTTVESDQTTGDAFAALAPPLLLLAIGRCSW